MSEEQEYDRAISDHSGYWITPEEHKHLRRQVAYWENMIQWRFWQGTALGVGIGFVLAAFLISQLMLYTY